MVCVFQMAFNYTRICKKTQYHAHKRSAIKWKEAAKYLYKKYGYKGAFTCKDCAQRFTCHVAFDLYNTEGDCLAEK